MQFYKLHLLNSFPIINIINYLFLNYNPNEDHSKSAPTMEVQYLVVSSFHVKLIG